MDILGTLNKEIEKTELEIGINTKYLELIKKLILSLEPIKPETITYKSSVTIDYPKNTEDKVIEMFDITKRIKASLGTETYPTDVNTVMEMIKREGYDFKGKGHKDALYNKIYQRLEKLYVMGEIKKKALGKTNYYYL